ncbi:hypothetical protein Nmel_016789 [Mimus melanotis]
MSGCKWKTQHTASGNFSWKPARKDTHGWRLKGEKPDEQRKAKAFLVKPWSDRGTGHTFQEKQPLESFCRLRFCAQQVAPI